MHPQGAVSASPASARRCRIRRSRASAAARATPSTSPCAARDWDTLVDAARRSCKASSRRAGLVDRRRHRLPGRRARARRSSPIAARATDLGVIVSDLANTVSALVGGNDRRQVLDRRAAASTSRMRLLAGAAHAPRGPRATSACARTSGDARAAVAGRDAARAAGAAVDQPRSIASAPSASPATSRPVTRRARRWRTVARARARTLPLGYRVVAGGQSSQLGETTSGLVFALVDRHPRRVHGAREPVQLVPAPGHGAHDPAARARGRGARALRRGQDAQRLQHDRPPPPDGHREEELDPPRRVREPGARARGRSTRATAMQARRARCACGRS